MEIPPITDQEVEQEWAAQRERAPAIPRYVGYNLVLIRKSFGEGAYRAAMAQMEQDTVSGRWASPTEQDAVPAP